MSTGHKSLKCESGIYVKRPQLDAVVKKDRRHITATLAYNVCFCILNEEQSVADVFLHYYCTKIKILLVKSDLAEAVTLSN